jgi:hypothetical protein
MEIKETLVKKDLDYAVHPIGGRIYLLPPAIISLLYAGNSVDFYVSERRDLTPLVIGVMAMNLVSAKTLSMSYPNTLIDPVLWRPEFVKICKKLVFRTENGIEASLKTLQPSNFVYLRVSNTEAKAPTLRVLFERSLDETTINAVLGR